MSKHMQVTDKVTVGPQPNEAEIKSLGDQGFQTIINFRTAGEEEQPLSPDAEGDIVRSAGLQYLHIPVSTDSISEQKVDEFRSQLENLPKPIFAHCKSGKRAGAMMMMHLGAEKDMTGAQTIKKAEDMGFECDVPKLKKFVQDYVDHKTRSTA